MAKETKIPTLKSGSRPEGVGEKTKLKPKKKKILRGISSGRFYIQAGFNNTIISITDEQGNVLAWASTGTLGFSGTRKSTPYAATLVAKTIIGKAADLGLRKAQIFVKGVGPGRDSVIRAFQAANFDIISIADITSIPHNGCRAKKPRRV